MAVRIHQTATNDLMVPLAVVNHCSDSRGHWKRLRRGAGRDGQRRARPPRPGGQGAKARHSVVTHYNAATQVGRWPGGCSFIRGLQDPSPAHAGISDMQLHQVSTGASA